jgi:hypothetical protein
VPQLIRLAREGVHVERRVVWRENGEGGEVQGYDGDGCAGVHGDYMYMED